MHPYVGHFISKDPIGLLGGLNVYAYGINAIGWSDPLGLSSSNCPLNCPAGTIDPSSVHFMQSSAKNQTGDYTVLGNPWILQTLLGSSTTFDFCNEVRRLYLG